MNKRNGSEGYSPLFWILSSVSITAMLVSNVSAFKMAQIGPWVLPAAVFMFPVTYIIGDVIAEVYGAAKAKMVAYASFAANGIAVAYFAMAVWLPSPVWFDGSEAFAMVLGSTPRVMAAGLAAFLVGTLVNIGIMDRMKGMHGERRFALRAIVSTVFGEGVDALIFITVAFYGTMPVPALVAMVITQASFKVVYEILILPLTTYIKDRVRTYERGSLR